MLDKLIGALVGYAICKLLAGGSDFLSNIFHVSHKTGPGPGPSPSPALTTTVVNFPTEAPKGLPAWPMGWRVYPSPIPSSVVQRAVALLPVMAVNEHKTEMGPDGWVTYYKSKQGTKTGVTAWIPKVAVATAAA
jgi:hypothetical protein